MGHFLATSERLFEEIHVRCSDIDSKGGRVTVGNFDAEGLCVGSESGTVREVDIWLAVAKN